MTLEAPHLQTPHREKESSDLNMDKELLKIAEKDLWASQVLYENGLYPQAVFSFQQSVEKANKAFALITNQVTEKELPRDIGHFAIRIYQKSIKHQKIKYEQFDEHMSEIPELRNTSLLKGFNVRRDVRQFEHFLSYLKELEKNKNESIFFSSWDIRRFLKEIESAKNDAEKCIQKISKFKMTERNLIKTKKNMMEMYNIFLKYNPIKVEEEINNLENIDIKQLEISIKKYVKLLCSVSFISASLINLAIISLPHSSITRYPINDLSPVKIYNTKLPIVKKLPDLIEAQDKALNELKIFTINLK